MNVNGTDEHSSLLQYSNNYSHKKLKNPYPTIIKFLKDFLWFPTQEKKWRNIIKKVEKES
jgi:hypothetical protein